MGIQELYYLYNYLDKIIIDDEEWKINEGIFIETYMPDEYGIWQLYRKIIEGEATRKDFLIFAIKDMIDYIDKNNITVSGTKSTFILKFKRLYCK